MKIFLTSTLHHDFNLAFNPKLTAILEDKGFIVHMPQRDTDQKAPIPERVKQNFEAIKNVDASVVVLENSSMNLAAETGYTFGIGCPTIGLAKKGTFIDGMVQGALNTIVEVDDLENIDSYINQLVEAIENYEK